MREIWKYEVPVDDEVHEIDLLDVPILHVGCQLPDRVAFWVEVDTEELADTRPRTRRFRVFGTGHPISSEWNWVGTVPLQGLPLVWHLYERDF